MNVDELIGAYRNSNDLLRLDAMFSWCLQDGCRSDYSSYASATQTAKQAFAVALKQLLLKYGRADTLKVKESVVRDFYNIYPETCHGNQFNSKLHDSVLDARKRIIELCSDLFEKDIEKRIQGNKLAEFLTNWVYAFARKYPDFESGERDAVEMWPYSTDTLDKVYPIYKRVGGALSRSEFKSLAVKSGLVYLSYYNGGDGLVYPKFALDFIKKNKERFRSELADIIARQTSSEELIISEMVDTTLEELLFGKKDPSEDEIISCLMRNLDLIEPGLILADVQKTVSSGRIDLLCKDSFGNLVVVEVKREAATSKDVGQLVGYLPAVGAARGILVAKDTSTSAENALKTLNPKISITIRTFADLLGARDA
jgi:hypothetical protein